jgi:hypothetical protein
MTTLSEDAILKYEVGVRNEFPVIAAEIIYEGAAVGLVKASGHAQPLTSADKFVGFCEKQVDNSDGAAAALNVRVKRVCAPVLAITGAVITDVGVAVYAQDDNAFSFVPTSGVFIGFMSRFTASGYGVVQVDVDNNVDPHEGFAAVTLADNATLDAEDCGKCICMGTDAKTFTLPAVMGIGKVRFLNVGAYGAVKLNIAPNANDSIESADVTVTEADSWANTKATANRGDYVDLEYGDGDGWSITRMKGVWALTAV